MTRNERARMARSQLDQRFAAASDLKNNMKAPGRGGWVRAIRGSLGMTVMQLAQRMGTSDYRVRELEDAETIGTAQLFSLQRAAEAMNCTVVYALVPNASLEAFYDRQARTVAREQLKWVEQTMALEGQSVSREASERILEDYIRTKLPPNEVWNAEDDFREQLLRRKGRD
ncbi:mobile mystery protein A [Dongia sp.]|uniref:mobile mystery protein A n=1 Tax=Dongia sp. TaxID=1977262 RepID=UPI0037536DFE